jgi:CheY-like chemotaxis protein
MHTPPIAHIPHPKSSQELTLSAHKEYGEVFTVCTQCKRVLLPSLRKGISIRISKEEEDQWIEAGKLSDSQTAASLSHGLCTSCFNRLDEKLLSSPSSFSSKKSVLNKSASSPQLLRNQRAGPMRVLVVDDNRLQRQIHKRMVDQAGFECDVASTGQQAIELVQKHSYSLILMDLVMSPADGWSTSRKIRTLLLQTLGCLSLPTIVAVTGLYVDDKLVQECKDAGMDDVVQKPVSPTILHRVLSRHAGP